MKCGKCNLELVKQIVDEFTTEYTCNGCGKKVVDYVTPVDGDQS